MAALFCFSQITQIAQIFFLADLCRCIADFRRKDRNFTNRATCSVPHATYNEFPKP